jgi:hypothetical protein
MADSGINNHTQIARLGMDTDSSVGQIQQGKVSYALNANVQNFDGNSINYQNEHGNEECLQFPEGYSVIGRYSIPEQSKHIFFLVNPQEGKSEIGYMESNNCLYKTLINADCLNFHIDYPIHKCVHKVTNCGIEIYWTDAYNPRRYLNLEELPYKRKDGTEVCDDQYTSEIDCNKLNVQPDFNIPNITVEKVISGGNLTAGTIQFAIQYCDVQGGGYTSYYSVTNPLPVANTQLTTPEFNYPVGKSIVLNIDNIDISGVYKYFNLAVIKTINNIPSVELVGTYFIDASSKQIIYSGQNQTQIRLSINDIFEKFPTYEIADDLTAVNDVLVWKGLTSVDRMNLQKIANKITLQWQTWRIPSTEDYKDELNATNLRGYLRDEVYPFEIVWLLTNGKQLDGFHIPGRELAPQDFTFPDVVSSDPDYIGPDGEPNPYWRNNNTATILGTESTSDETYKGPHQYGEFSYWESSELYPCDTEVWGELAGQPIRHHKFPDVKLCPIFENPTIDTDSDGKYTNLNMNNRAIYPIGVRLDVNQIKQLIIQSDLTQEQKDSIVGFKIIRGDRTNNKSIVGKGILRNVGKYERQGTEYYFPNYPYNDLKQDPFLLAKSNAYNAECRVYEIVASANGAYQYTDCFTNTLLGEQITTGETIQICSMSTPTIEPSSAATITEVGFDSYELSVQGFTIVFGIPFPAKVYFTYVDINGNSEWVEVSAGSPVVINVEIGSIPEPLILFLNTSKYTITKLNALKNETCYPENLKGFEDEDSKSRHVFNSPETSFGQPFLGDVLKIENVLFGTGKAHFTEVKKNALYRLISKEAQEDALESAIKIADITSPFSSTALFTAYQAYLQIYLNGITRRNYGYSYNSILNYNYYADVNDGEGIKQRKIDNSQYLYPGVQSVADDLNINNYQRETSVYVKTNSALPYPSQTNSLLLGSESLIEDSSRYIASQIDCSQPEQQFDIKSVVYYASLKNSFLNQWGQIYSYEKVDTGTQVIFSDTNSTVYIFGGDTFISKFAFKTKLPFFIDNRVNAPDDSDIFYDEIGNIAYPEYWHSARSILFDYADSGSGIGSEILKNIISIKAHYFDCPNNQLPPPDSTANPKVVNPNRTYYDGKMYMFAYGVPIFYCESSINTDLRQAFNNREGDFYPHVSSGIPDDWLQESNVPIVQDNTYYYNVSYSKQNKENFFSNLPSNWEEELCFTNFPFRAIYSDPQGDYVDKVVNNWLIYRPVSYFDFPQNYGDFTSIDSIQNRGVLARFHNKSLLYNTLLTINTSNPQAAYLGNDTLFKSSPPVDFAETDLGYVGSQHKFLLKVPQGQVTIDAKRGQIFLVSGNQAEDLSKLGFGLNRFFTDHLPFEITKYFDVNIDNHFKGIGIHGVYDSKFDRIIITKLDYIPLSNEVKYDIQTKEFYVEISRNSAIIRNTIQLGDSEYFCNKSWTLSFNLNTGSWISFHSYIPNFYIAENNFFYSGLNTGCDLELIVAEIVETTTTTTSFTPNPFDCELEGELQVIDCELEGSAFLLTECELEGNAFDITPSTTTTTSTLEETTTTTTTIEESTTTTTTTLE